MKFRFMNYRVSNYENNEAKKRRGIILALAAVLIFASCSTAKALFDEEMDSRLLGNCAIAEIGEALTFARFIENDQIQLVLVNDYREGIISGVILNEIDTDLPADPLAFFRKYGYNGIAAMISTPAQLASFPEEAAVFPMNPVKNNIAIGYNYISHVEEVKEDEPPFLYPKKVSVSRFNSTISVTGYKLPDYELELGLVILDDMTREHQEMDYLGFLLVNDFTDRKPIVQKHVDVLFGKYEALPDGIQGYSDAKNLPGAFPVGNLLVIPENYIDFMEQLNLSLYLNGGLRQKADPSLLIWGPEKSVEEIFNRSHWDFEYRNQTETLQLLDQPDLIPAGTIILSGTPEGVLFKKSNMWNPRAFLKTGDELVLFGEYLGFIRNRITE